MAAQSHFAPHAGEVDWAEVMSSMEVKEYSIESAKCLRDHLKRNLLWPTHFINHTTLAIKIYGSAYLTIGPSNQKDVPFRAADYIGYLSHKGFTATITHVPSRHGSSETDLCIRISSGAASAQRRS